MPISQKCHDTDRQDLHESQDSGATRIVLASIPHHQKLAHVFLFFEKFERPQRLCAKDYKVLEAATLGRTDKHKEKG
jgi:hypothetical protein